MAADFSAMDVALLDEFGEVATYTPKGGAARDIAVIVERGTAGVDPEISALPDEPLTVFARNHATLGILGTAFNRGGDVLAVALRPGGALRACRDLRIVELDASGILLEARQ